MEYIKLLLKTEKEQGRHSSRHIYKHGDGRAAPIPRDEWRKKSLCSCHFPSFVLLMIIVRGVFHYGVQHENFILIFLNGEHLLNTHLQRN
jgi:hypothetical protein